MKEIKIGEENPEQKILTIKNKNIKKVTLILLYLYFWLKQCYIFRSVIYIIALILCNPWKGSKE